MIRNIPVIVAACDYSRIFGVLDNMPNSGTSGAPRRSSNQRSVSAKASRENITV